MSSQLITEFDIWRPGYANASVAVYVAGTNTLATLYQDVNLSTLYASNPVTLLSDGDGNGKFPQSLYVGVSYELDIDTSETTGQQTLQLNNLVGIDASQALVTVYNSSQENTLDAIVQRRVDAQNYGLIEIGNNAGDAATNTATILAAIGALGGGGEVFLPAGIIRVLQMTIPSNVVLHGQGKDVTTLMSILGDKSFIMAGTGGGFRNLTIDGNIVSNNSIGIYGVAMNGIIFDQVTVQNFQTGIYIKGGTRNYWKNLDVINCTTGAKLVGDSDSSNTNAGTAFTWNSWNGGRFYACTTALYLGYKDKICSNFVMRDVVFDSSITMAVQLNGAQFLEFKNCEWTANAGNFVGADDTTLLTGTHINDNVVIDVLFDGGSMSAGTWAITGTAQYIVLRGMQILGVAFTMGTPLNNNIVFKDCFEDTSVTVAGQATKLMRDRSVARGSINGTTTSNVATTAYAVPMVSGQVIQIEAQVVGKQINGINMGIFHVSVGAYCTAATLNYNLMTAHYTLGDILTGATSGATGRILAATNSGTTGSVSLNNVQGTFLSGELLTGTSGGSSNANGPLVPGTVTIDSNGVVALRTAYKTDTTWAVTAVAGVSEVDLQVAGNTSQTVNWTVKVDVVTS